MYWSIGVNHYWCDWSTTLQEFSSYCVYETAYHGCVARLLYKVFILISYDELFIKKYGFFP